MIFYNKRNVKNKEHKSFYKTRGGFTLVELLIVIGITATLSFISIGFYANQQKEKILDNTTQEIVQYLRYAQQKSVVQEQGLSWGVHFSNPTNEQDFYALFSGLTYTNPIDKRYLPNGIQFQNLPEGYSTDIRFEKLTGFLYGTNYQEIVLQGLSSSTKNIIVCQTGIITYGTTTDVCGAVDTTPPEIQTVNITPTYSSYVGSPFTISANVVDNSVYNCEYTINGGVNWYSATLSGNAPNYVCSKTGITSTNGSSLSINIRATGRAGTGTGTAVAKTVDTIAPSNGTLNANLNSGKISLSWSGFSDSGSGLATSNTYKLVYQTGSSPSSCSAGTQIYLGTNTSYDHTGLTNGTTYYYRVCAYDAVGNLSTGATASALFTDTTPPTIGTVTASNYSYGSYVSSPFTLSATATDNDSNVTSCEYTINGGTNWYAATLSGSSPTWTCTASNITASNGTSLSLNIRATSSGGTGTGTSISKTVDSAIPTASDNWTDNWTATSPVTVTITPTDGSGSGIQATYYCVDTTNSCTPTTSGTSASVSCTSGSNCTQYVRYYTKDNVNNVSTTYSKRVRQDLQAPTASDNWTDNWTATSPVTVGINSFDGAPYRKPITINNTSNSSTLTDYQVLITIDTYSLINTGKMRSDCGDIIFTDSDGLTLLNYWLESDCNTVSTKLWVKVPSIPASSNKTIYMYYGNVSATSGSNGSATFGYFQSFAGLSSLPAGWSSITNTVLTYYSTYTRVAPAASVTGWYGIFTNSPSLMTSFPTIIEWYGNQYDAANAGIIVGLTTQVGLTNSPAYSLNEGNTTTNLLYIGNNNVQFYASTGWSDTSAPKIYTMKISSATSISVLINYSVVSTQSLISTTPSYFVIEPSNNGGAVPSTPIDIYWLRVRKYASPEPTTSVGSEETSASGSGIQATYYCVDTTNSCTPTTSGTSASVSCASGSSCTQYVRYYTKDNVNNISTTYSKRVRQDLQAPTASDNWTDNWTATSPVTVTITPTDGSGSGIQATYYCVDTTNSCTPTTSGTSASVSCASGSSCTQYVRYYTKDNVNNVSTTYSKRVRQDLVLPIDGTLTATPGNAQVALSWSGFSDSGSGLATSNTYKLVYQTGSSPSSCAAGTQIYLGTNTSYDHTGLTNGTTYYYRVCAYDAAGNVSTGATASATPQTEITVNWNTPHCYSDYSTYTSSTYSCPAGTTKFKVYHYVATESSYDYYYIYSGGTQMYKGSGCITGGSCASSYCSAPAVAWSSEYTYNGSIYFKLTTDGSVDYYGVQVVKILCY